MEDDSPEGWYYLGTDGSENGPLNFRIIRAHLRLGTLPADIPVWREGLQDWTEAKNISLFRNMGHSVPPSPMVEETVTKVENDIYDAKTNYVTEGGTPLFPSTPERHFLLHQDRHDGKKFPSGQRPTGANAGTTSSSSKKQTNQWKNIQGGEWYYCSQDKEPRGPVPTVKIIELARKNIIKANSWVWSQDEQSYWIKFSECPRFQDLDIQYHGNHSANTPSVSYSSVLRAQRGQGQQNQQQHNRPHKQHFAGSSPRHQLTVSSSLNGLDSVGGKKRHTRQKKHKKKTGATTTTTTTPAVAAAAVAAPAPSKASQETEDSFDFSSWQKSIENAQIENELERANSELHKAAEQLGSKDIKLKEYKSKIRLLKEELKIRDSQITQISEQKENNPNPNVFQVASAEEDSILRAQLEIAEMKLKEQDQLLERKNQEIKKLEVTVAETDSELTKARIALSKELSWILEESAT